MRFAGRVMMPNMRITRWLAPLLVLGANASAGGGSLPALQERPWEGYFIAHETRGYHFGLGCDGEGVIRPLDRKGEPAGHKEISLRFTVEETLPDGRVVARQIDPESLATTDKATTKPEAVKFTGKVTGGASFEATTTIDGERIEVGGRVVDPGEAKNPLRFAIRLYAREFYPGAEADDKQFQRKVKDDEIRFETVDGKRGKIEMAEAVDVARATGAKGLSLLRMEAAAYEGRRFEFSATAGGALELQNPAAGKLLIDGVTLTWRHDPAKDPEGKSRLAVEIR